MDTWQERAVKAEISAANGYIQLAGNLVILGELDRASEHLELAILAARTAISDIGGDEAAASESFARYIDACEKQKQRAMDK